MDHRENESTLRSAAESQGSRDRHASEKGAPDRHGSARRAAAERHLPLKPVVFHILFALAETDLHGYGVIQGVREGSEGRIQLQTGPFYRHLRKLIDENLVAEAATRPADDDPRRGAYYHLTRLGREVLSAEAARLAALVSATRAIGITDGDPSA